MDLVFVNSTSNLYAQFGEIKGSDRTKEVYKI